MLGGLLERLPLLLKRPLVEGLLLGGLVLGFLLLLGFQLRLLPGLPGLLAFSSGLEVARIGRFHASAAVGAQVWTVRVGGDGDGGQARIAQQGVARGTIPRRRPTGVLHALKHQRHGTSWKRIRASPARGQAMEVANHSRIPLACSCNTRQRHVRGIGGFWV